MNTTINEPKDTLDPETKSNVDRWLNENYDVNTKNEIRKMLIENPKGILDAFYTNLSFGTGGLRGIMGLGSNRVNVYTIRAASQGLADYIHLQTLHSQEHSVIIGYDSRHNSRLFAEEAAKVLAGNGIKVFLFNEIRPTPLISFGCRLKNCTAGIMITASHNPREYNGFKVYWTDGAQVVSPHDKNIIQMVGLITELAQVKQVPTIEHRLIILIDSEVDQAYLNAVMRQQNYSEDNHLHGKELNIVYTSLHGTGITLIPKLLTHWGFSKLYLVEEQVHPEGDFTTCPSPNPEEPKALSLGIKKMKETGSDILIATDPDADRVGVAIMHHGNVEILTGNQIAVLLLQHLCEALTSKNKMAANGAFVKTIVTTELFQSITEYYQKPCFNVMPGFKYIAEKIRLWESEPRGNQFIFGGEDSNGYLYGTQVRDKDGVSASALICEMALQAKLQNKTLLDLLHELYHRYGVYEEVMVTINYEDSKEGKEKRTKSIQLLRRAPPKSIAGVKVIVFEDYEQSLKMNFFLKQNEPLLHPKSNLMLFWLEDGSKLVIRPSGTEPKIKIYSCVFEKEFQSITEAQSECLIRANSYIDALKARLNEEV